MFFGLMQKTIAINVVPKTKKKIVHSLQFSIKDVLYQLLRLMYDDIGPDLDMMMIHRSLLDGLVRKKTSYRNIRFEFEIILLKADRSLIKRIKMQVFNIAKSSIFTGINTNLNSHKIIHCGFTPE